MCGRFVLVSDLSRVTEEFQIAEVRSDYVPLQDAFPGREVFAVVREGVNRLSAFRWGLVPSWAKDPVVGKRMFNARAETLSEKPSFRNIFKKQRCLIIADGFYEWEKTAKKRISNYYRLKSGAPFSMAGLYDLNRRGGQDLRTCTIITTSPNDLIRPVHDRMPAIVSRQEHAIWLDPAISDPELLLPLLRPYPAEFMTVQPGGIPPRF
jgi:putative SOS response-associated peptidase YedK